ncbi:FMN-binding protein [Stieleria sp. TO1_6]|uniref:FMN-binding protein n=1 Tax=Stieleria tagensis TaxID=2956795 RepID=UPI00209BA0C7|nr:FMN-binding protein [Stieleria tagensis]MCO8121285.1 FMN-binding protein [Stieleria tagensis]
MFSLCRNHNYKVAMMQITQQFGTLVAFVLFTLVAATHAPATDTVEFLNGSKLSGTIKSIRKADKEFDFETSVGNRTFSRVYPFHKVHAVTYQGTRYELTPLAGATESADATPTTRSKSEVLALIAAAGQSPPEWFDSTELDYPESLDLAWPLQPPKGPWQAHKNMGQYIWSVINENPSRWHSGIKLIHHLLTLHKDNPQLLKRDMNALGSAYFRLMQDYPRAAFWYQKGKPTAATQDGVHLAECYWRLGNRAMALQMLQSRSLNLNAIKLLGDMGQIDQALKLTAVYQRSNANNQANLLAGDALRKAGKLDQAIEYYQRVIDSDNHRNEEYEQRAKARAQESIDTIRLYDQADVSTAADGTYTDSSTGYNGKLVVEVTVESGELKTVKITDHKEKQFYSSLTDTPAQLIQNQSVQGVDGTSGATITSQAIVNATAKALAKAKP